MRMTRADFATVAKKRPIRLSEGVFSLVFYPNTLNTKVSCVISKKNAKKAVTRHAIKRLVYKAFLKYPTIKTGWYVFFLRSSLPKYTFAEVSSQIGLLLGKI